MAGKIKRKAKAWTYKDPGAQPYNRSQYYKRKTGKTETRLYPGGLQITWTRRLVKRPRSIVRRSRKKHGYNVYRYNTAPERVNIQVQLTIKWFKGRQVALSKGFSNIMRSSPDNIAIMRRQAFFRAYAGCAFSPDRYIILKEDYLYFKRF